MKVSVVVPIYNAEKTLKKCIDSLLSQTMTELEIILVNDGSTDGSQKIIDEYVLKFPGRILSFVQENGGQGKARNQGIRLCSGTYIGFVDSDDYVEASMYETMYKLAIKEHADMVMCDYYDICDKVCKVIRVKDITETKQLLIDPKVSPWNKLYLASRIKESGVEFREGLIYEDTAFYVNLVPHIRKCINVHQPFVYHINWPGSTTGLIGAQRYIQMFEIMDGIVGYYHSNLFYDTFFEELEYLYSKMLLGSSFQRLASLEDKKMRNVYLKESLEKVLREFPKFRKNKYYRGTKLQLYVFIINKVTVTWVGKLIYMMSKWKDRI